MAYPALQFAHPAAFGAGVVCHVFLFRYGEWDLATNKVIGVFALLQAVLTIGIPHLLAPTPVSTLSAAGSAGLIMACLISGIFTSMLVYRAFFHRLNRFPGPFAARLSNFYPTALSAKNCHLYEEVQNLHDQYGDFVRLGPSELSVNNRHAIQAIHSAQTTCVKGPWYGILHPMVSLQLIRNKQEHIVRRKVWDRGFSSKALREYEPRVVKYTDQLLSHIEQTVGLPISATDWFNFYSFDVMGDLAWGKSFNMLENGVKHYFMKSLHESMASVGLFSHLIWLFPIFKSTPILNSESNKFWNWVNSQVQERKKNIPDRPDVFSWILDAHNEKKRPTKQDETNLVGDAYLIAVAGSDTTAATLSCLFFHLAQDPKTMQALQAEIDEYMRMEQKIDSVTLSKLPFLNAVIDESLRLHPPVPSGVQRMSPPEGITIDGTFIPGNTILQIPTHTICRDPRYWESPNDFIPERWTSHPELVKDASVFTPFSTGRYSCIGKQLGLMEVRHVVCKIVHKYNVAFAPGQSAQAFLDGKRDNFTLSLGQLELVFTERK